MTCIAIVSRKFIYLLQMIIFYFTKEHSYLKNIMLYAVTAPILVSRCISNIEFTDWINLSYDIQYNSTRNIGKRS